MTSIPRVSTLARPLAFLLLAAAVGLSGCFTPAPDAAGPTSGPTPPSPTPPPAADPACARFNVDAEPASGPAAMPRTLTARFENCDDEPIRLAHACTRAMDLRLIVLYNSTDPERELPPGVGPMASYLVDNPLANKPLACATAPPHVRTVPAGTTLTYAVAWSALVADPRCSASDCLAALASGRYIVAANAENADTGEAYIASAWITLT